MNIKVYYEEYHNDREQEFDSVGDALAFMYNCHNNGTAYVHNIVIDGVTYTLKDTDYGEKDPRNT